MLVCDGQCRHMAHRVGSLRRGDTSGVGGEADMPRTSLNRRDWTRCGPHHPSAIPAKAHAVVDAFASGEKDRMAVRQITLYCSIVEGNTHGATDAGNFIRQL